MNDHEHDWVPFNVSKPDGLAACRCSEWRYVWGIGGRIVREVEATVDGHMRGCDYNEAGQLLGVWVDVPIMYPAFVGWPK